MARMPHGWKPWLVVGIIAAAIGVVGGPFVYFNFIRDDAPPPLTLQTPAGTTAAAGETDGTWKIASGSQVGYRVKEVLFGQSAEAVGRTTKVEGTATVSGTTVTAAQFTADMASVESDQSRRDRQFRGRIMQVETYPMSTFKLTTPISLGTIPGTGERRTVSATGELTLRGVTKTVTVQIQGVYTGSAIQVAGSIPIVFSEWDIPNPSFGPAQTEDNGLLEFALTFTHA